MACGCCDISASPLASGVDGSRSGDGDDRLCRWMVERAFSCLLRVAWTWVGRCVVVVWRNS